MAPTGDGLGLGLIASRLEAYRSPSAIPRPEGGSLTPTAQQSPMRHGRRSPQPQHKPRAWNATLLPSQQRAAARRAAVEHELTVRRWLRDLARR
jgi:hypothetical protein